MKTLALAVLSLMATSGAASVLGCRATSLVNDDICLLSTQTFVGRSAISLAAPAEQTRRIQSREIRAYKGRGNDIRAMGSDGRLVVLNGEANKAVNPGKTIFHAMLFKPEAVRLNADGTPSFDNAFSEPVQAMVETKTPCSNHGDKDFCVAEKDCFWEVTSSTCISWTAAESKNHHAICYTKRFDETNEHHPWTAIGNGKASTSFLLFWSTSGGIGRREVTVVAEPFPFTEASRVVTVTTGDWSIVYMPSHTGGIGIEPTITLDGQLMVTHRGGKLVYSWSKIPCGANGDWQPAKYIHEMRTDPNVNSMYDIAKADLKMADGTPVDEDNLLRGAYPWLDHDGRNLFFSGAKCTPIKCKSRREAYSFIGGDTGWKIVNIDGSPNTLASRAGAGPVLVHNSPMWSFASDRFHDWRSSPNSAIGSMAADISAQVPDLPVTPTHEVIPLFGVTGYYSEVNIVDVWKARKWDVLWLPFNELLHQEGKLLKTDASPDLSGHFQTATVHTANAHITKQTSDTCSVSGEHSVGRALRVIGGTGAEVTLGDTRSGEVPRAVASNPAKGLTLHVSFLWDGTLHNGILLDHPSLTIAVLSADNSVWCKLSRFAFQPALDQDVEIATTPGSVQTNKWTHFAVRYDASDSAVAIFVNGRFNTEKVLPPLPAGTGTVRQIALQGGKLHIGGNGDDLMNAAAPATFFSGLIDELRIFSHARSHRHICKSAFGADCLGSINYIPNGMQREASHQHPLCTSATNSIPCLSAYHALCANKGAEVDVAHTKAQLGSSLDVKVPMFGRKIDGLSSIACGPLEHKSRAVEWWELTKEAEQCKNADQADTPACNLAYTKFCAGLNLGFNAGALFEVTARAWVTCFTGTLAAACGGQQGSVPTGLDAEEQRYACYTPSFLLSFS
eukprot:TRINITY_DN67410_c0_g1_i1.p1 TRINITY_DN67410_c0_g1~~TRINITY_DN67410_c0_g1_i1.p1  ORF type:complete len:901 (+),score=113.92 TRINITY_DN67410_c0_g1_i1:62-2764(+)